MPFMVYRTVVVNMRFPFRNNIIIIIIWEYCDVRPNNNNCLEKINHVRDTFPIILFAFCFGKSRTTGLDRSIVPQINIALEYKYFFV